MHSFQNFIVRLIPNHPPPLETRIWKLVVRALATIYILKAALSQLISISLFLEGEDGWELASELKFSISGTITFSHPDRKQVKPWF